MKFAIGVDCEGVACAVGTPNGTLNDSRNFEWVKRQATREADAAARALFDAGAEKVIVWDCHGGSLNLDYDALDRRCDIALGAGFEQRFPGMDETFDGALLVGYHPMDSTVDGVMAHTMSSKTFQYMKVNDRLVGEIAIDTAIAGHRGVPLIFVASDDKGVAEALDSFPKIETTITKYGMGWNAAISKHPARVVDEIYDAVGRAVKRLGEFEPFVFESPIVFERRFKRLEGAQAASRGGWERVDPYTCRRTIKAITDVY